MNFGQAIELAKQGKAVARSGWDGKGMWVTVSPGAGQVPAMQLWSPANRSYAESRGGSVSVLPAMTMRTATGEILMGWLASQTDMLSDDWNEVEAV